MSPTTCLPILIPETQLAADALVHMSEQQPESPTYEELENAQPWPPTPVSSGHTDLGAPVASTEETIEVPSSDDDEVQVIEPPPSALQDYGSLDALFEDW